MSASSKARNFRFARDLSELRRRAIDKLVEEVRVKLQYAKPPLDLAQVEANLPEIQIIELPASPVSSELTYLDMAGKIAQIQIRQKDLTPSKVLAVCHALGHYYLHPREPFACRLDFYGEHTDCEVEATYFAETLMMPHRLIREMYRSVSKDFDPVYKLAKSFSVKRQIMEDRLQALNLL